MKTPKREYKNPADKFPGDIEPDSWEADYQMQDSRWKRKNRVKQYKRTIARLTDAQTAVIREFNALWLGDHLKAYSPEWDAFMILRRIKTPAEDATLDEKLDHWLTLRKAAAKALDAACFAAKAYGAAKEKEEEKARACHPETDESGQQTDLPTKCGQQDRKEQR